MFDVTKPFKVLKFFCKILFSFKNILGTSYNSIGRTHSCSFFFTKIFSQNDKLEITILEKITSPG